nr:microtubule-associated protein 4-like [Dermatophagoides farinae]
MSKKMSTPVSPGISHSSLNSNDSQSTDKKMPINKVTVGTAKGPNIKNVKSKIGSLNNVRHKPAGGDKKIESQKLKWETKSRIGSLDNATHKPQGGNVRVVTQKLDWKVQSKVGSLDNVKHVPGGGNVRIFDEKYSTTTNSIKSGETTPATTATAPQINNNNNPIDDLLRETNEKSSNI